MREPASVRAGTPSESGLVEGGSKRRQKSKVHTYVPAVVFVAVILGLWQLIVTLSHVPAYILPSVVSIVATAFGSERGPLFVGSLTTVQEVVIGFAAAVVIGFALATAVVHSRTISRAVYPVIVASQTVPILAIAPLLIIWFGFGLMPKVLVVALIGFFPVTINSIAGMRSIERDFVYLMRSVGASRFQVFMRVRLPNAGPLIFAGIKQAAVISVVGAVVGEWVGAQAGLGPIMLAADTSFRTATVFAAILYLSIMAILLFAVVSVIERLVMRWYFMSRVEGKVA